MANDMNLIEQYEIKFFIDTSKVLTEGYKLKDDIINLFSISEDPKLREILFIDTTNQDMYKAGWILRNRRKTNKYELTYKKRYKTNDNDVNSALNELQNDFKKIDSKAKIELELGYTNKTLSLSFEENETIPSDSESNSLSIEELQKMFLENAPGEFLNWNQDSNWGIKQITSSNMCCPINAVVYSGKWNETTIDIEIWSRKTIDNTDVIAEISFKSTDSDIASNKHSELKDFLSNKGLLITQDLSKTQWALTCRK